MTSPPLEHARALVLRHGWNAMAYQILNPGIRRWFSADGEAVVGYLGNSLQTLRARRTLEFENSRLRSHMPVADELIGDSPALRDLRERLRRAAPQSATIRAPCAIHFASQPAICTTW